MGLRGAGCRFRAAAWLAFPKTLSFGVYCRSVEPGELWMSECAYLDEQDT